MTFKQIMAGVTVALMVLSAGLYYVPPVYQQIQANNFKTPTITFPQSIKGQTGKHIVIAPTTTDADKIEWLSIDNNLEIIPEELLSNSTSSIAIASKPGTYTIYAIGVKNGNLGKHQSVQVIVADEMKAHPMPIDETPKEKQPLVFDPATGTFK